jgi:integrase
MLERLGSAKDRALWATALYAGLRRGELAGLHAADVDLATGVIRVERGWDQIEGEVAPKSKQGRRKVPIPAVLRDHLDAFLVDAPTSGGSSSTCARATTTAATPLTPRTSRLRRSTSAGTATHR